MLTPSPRHLRVRLLSIYAPSGDWMRRSAVSTYTVDDDDHYARTGDDNHCTRTGDDDHYHHHNHRDHHHSSQLRHDYLGQLEYMHSDVRGGCATTCTFSNDHCTSVERWYPMRRPVGIVPVSLWDMPTAHSTKKARPQGHTHASPHASPKR